MAPVIKFFRVRGIKLSAFTDNFTNQEWCKCKVIFQVYVIVLVFMSCGWFINWVKTILEPTRILLYLGFLWDTLRKTIALPEDKTTQVEPWTKNLLTVNKTTQENLECFLGTLISTTLAVCKAPFHYRALQRLLIISFKGGRSKSKSVRISHPSVVRELNWWASGGLRANRTSPWRPPKPTLQIWMDATD